MHSRQNVGCAHDKRTYLNAGRDSPHSMRVIVVRDQLGVARVAFPRELADPGQRGREHRLITRAVEIVRQTALVWRLAATVQHLPAPLERCRIDSGEGPGESVLRVAVEDLGARQAHRIGLRLPLEQARRSQSRYHRRQRRDGGQVG